MASRATEVTFPSGARTYRKSRTAARTTVYTRGTRLMFVAALLTFGIASIYTSLALLAQITPALFPGQTLTSALPILDYIPNQIDPTKGAAGDDSQFNRRVTVLVIGIDARAGWRPFEDGYLNDSNMVITLDPVAKTATALSLPRDLYVESRGKRDRFAHSYGKGWAEGHTVDAAAERVAEDVKANFQIDTDYYVVMDFQGVEDLVNAMGGIDIDIPADLSVDDWYYSNDDKTGVWVAFPPGMQHLDGYHAVAFGRHREQDSDFHRIRRQQLVLQTALAKAFTLNLLDLGKLKDVYDAYKGTVRTNMGYGDMIRYAPLLKQTNGKITTYSLADPVNGKETLHGIMSPEGMSVQTWDSDNVRYILSQVFTPAKYANANVEVQNGYGSDGEPRAAALGRYFQFVKGLPTVYLGPDQQTQPTTTITLYGDTKRELANEVAAWLGISPAAVRVEPRPEGSTLPDVIVVIGKDFKLPQ